MTWGARLAAIGTAVVLLGGVVPATAACTGGSKPGQRPAGSPTTEPQVIVPGRPGESASVLPGDKVTVPDGGYNDRDVWFVRAMIPHHEQAVQMAVLAGSRARNAQIRSLAARIDVAQNGEIAQLRAWLQARGLDGRLGHGDHAAMRGMQTPEALRALAAARGDRFDRMFVAMMSDHHRGAIDMATEVRKGGKDVQVEQIANEIAAEQASEIARMRDALAS